MGAGVHEAAASAGSRDPYDAVNSQDPVRAIPPSREWARTEYGISGLAPFGEHAAWFVFTSERGGPFTTDSFNWMVKRAGQNAKLPFQCHAHMLRHSAGYKLAGDGHDTRSIQDYLGHRDIRHTVRYTELSPKPFRDFWRD